MTEAKLASHQFDPGLPTDRLRAQASSPPNNQVDVAGGPFMRADGVTIEEIVAALTPVPAGGFGVQGGGLERWDLVTLNPEAGPAAFVVTPSILPQALGGTFVTSIPDIPSNHIPIAAVKVDEPGSVVVIASDIVDVRGFFHEVDKSAAGLGYTPSVFTDWNADADPGDVPDALDQLADRLNEGTAGLDVAAAGASGASKNASRNDHVHGHGDQGAGAANQHDSLQNDHAQVAGGNWDLTSPATVSAHLEEAAARVRGLEGDPYLRNANVFCKYTFPAGVLTRTDDRIVIQAGTIAMLYDDVPTGSPTLFLPIVQASDIVISTDGTIGTANGPETDFTGDPAASWINVFLIGDTTGSNPLAGFVSRMEPSGFDTTPDFVPTLPTGYDVFRRVGTAQLSTGPDIQAAIERDGFYLHDGHGIGTIGSLISDTNGRLLDFASPIVELPPSSRRMRISLNGNADVLTVPAGIFWGPANVHTTDPSPSIPVWEARTTGVQDIHASFWTDTNESRETEDRAGPAANWTTVSGYAIKVQGFKEPLVD